LKTTKNRSKDIDAEWTPFRAAEKKYKARFPPPDLSHVLDLASTAWDASETLASGCNLYCNGVEVIPLGQSGSASPSVCSAFSIPQVPGAQEMITRVTSVTF
jgi:alkylated DNA repair protein alkB family protein 1